MIHVMNVLFLEEKPCKAGGDKCTDDEFKCVSCVFMWHELVLLAFLFQFCFMTHIPIWVTFLYMCCIFVWATFIYEPYSCMGRISIHIGVWTIFTWWWICLSFL